MQKFTVTLTGICKISSSAFKRTKDHQNLTAQKVGYAHFSFINCNRITLCFPTEKMSIAM